MQGTEGAQSEDCHRDPKGNPKHDGVPLTPWFRAEVAGVRCLGARLARSSRLELLSRSNPRQVVLRCGSAAIPVKKLIRCCRLLAKDDVARRTFKRGKQTLNRRVISIEHGYAPVAATGCWESNLQQGSLLILLPFTGLGFRVAVNIPLPHTLPVFPIDARIYAHGSMKLRLLRLKAYRRGRHVLNAQIDLPSTLLGGRGGLRSENGELDQLRGFDDLVSNATAVDREPPLLSSCRLRHLLLEPRPARPGACDTRPSKASRTLRNR